MTLADEEPRAAAYRASLRARSSFLAGLQALWLAPEETAATVVANFAPLLGGPFPTPVPDPELES